MTTTKPAIKPVLKWAGGKTQLLKHILPLIPDDCSVYCEPFIGGGAVCFAAQPEKAVIADTNPDLIALYRAIQNNADELIDLLRTYQNTPDEYYRIRALDREPEWLKAPDVHKAARMLYLNATCFNGLHRVNAKGQFNVPYGRYKNPDIVKEDRIHSLHTYLSTHDVQILHLDFADTLNTLAGLPSGAFVYLDPPYDPISNTAAFTAYAKNKFEKNEQARLKQACDKLDAQGIRFLASNADTPFIRDLYKQYHVQTIKARRSVGASKDTRQDVSEVLIRNFD